MKRGFPFSLVLFTLILSLSFVSSIPLEEQKVKITEWNNQLQQYAEGKSPLTLDQINVISQERKEEMLSLLNTNPSVFSQFIVSTSVRDALPLEIQGNIEKPFEELGSLVEIIIDSSDSEEHLYKLMRDEEIYNLYFRSENKAPGSGGYYRLSGYLLDNNVAVDSLQPLLGVQTPPSNPYSNGVQKLAIFLISFKNAPFSFEKGKGRDAVYRSIDYFVKFYEKQSEGRLVINYKIFEYTIPEDSTSVIFKCRGIYEGWGGIDQETFLNTFWRLSDSKNFKQVKEEYPNFFGLTSEDFCGSVVGLSYVGNGNPGVAQLLDPNYMPSLIGHEFGHSRGLHHTVDCDNCLMRPSLGWGNTIDKAIFLPEEKELLGWNKNQLPLPIILVSDIIPILNTQGIPQGATFIWDTNLPVSSEVYFGNDPEELTQKGVEDKLLGTSTHQRFNIRGPESDGKFAPLETNKVYYYKIISTNLKGENIEKQGSFFMYDKSWIKQPNEEGSGGGIIDQSNVFVRGDANEDSQTDISDAVYILRYLFQGKPSPLCQDVADTNDDGKIDLTDSIYLLNHLFKGGNVIPQPSINPGFDPTQDALNCYIN